jgi:hypothetical protein
LRPARFRARALLGQELQFPAARRSAAHPEVMCSIAGAGRRVRQESGAAGSASDAAPPGSVVNARLRDPTASRVVMKPVPDWAPNGQRQNHSPAAASNPHQPGWASMRSRKPGSAALNIGGGAAVASASCAAAGNCAAGGSYDDGSGHLQAFVVNEASCGAARWRCQAKLPGQSGIAPSSLGARARQRRTAPGMPTAHSIRIGCRRPHR